MAVPQSTIRQQAEPHVHIVGKRCPWCDQPIPHEKFDEIHARIEAKERERSAAVERRLKKQVAHEKAQVEAKAKTEIEQAREKAAAAVAKAKKEAAAKEAAARADAKKTAEAQMAPKIAEAERAKMAAEQQLKSVKADQESVLTQRLQEQRDALEKAKTDAVNAEKSKAFNENLKFEEKLQELQRKLQKKTAEELGEGAEVDLFEALKTEFPSDQITRVNKGAAGADIIHKVVHNGQVCGCIIYDSKNRNAWRNDYVTKLRRDQLAAKADHAILSTQVFPAGARQLHIQDGVIVSNPARTVVLAQMLRKHVVQNHGLRLSNKARDQKTARLYEFITSERCAQLLDQIVTLTDDMLDLEVK
ncbi:MAG: DUF2130 domain-containing protein, partial [Alphaproteobacteria bacterium]|nr:DUF2130 domain-containing protein [Alphaproteobacteria bacterium]